MRFNVTFHNHTRMRTLRWVTRFLERVKPGQRVLIRKRPKTAPVALRAKLGGWMDRQVAHAANVHYAEMRPIPLTAMRHELYPYTTDCSGSVIGGYYAVGAPAPVANGYDGQGDTAAIRAHLPRRAHVADCRVGDPIVLGRDDNHAGQHVVMVRDAGSDPLVYSHGQEDGPWYKPLSVELAAHDGYYTAHDGGLG